MRVRSVATTLAMFALLLAAPGCKEDEPAPAETPTSETDVNIEVSEDGGSVGVEHHDESGDDVSVEVGTEDTDDSEGP